MENLPSNLSAPTPSLPERAAHREWIGGRALTLLSHYYRPDDPVELTAAIGQDWADVLQALPQELIQRACIEYLRDSPRNRPSPGAIYQRAAAMLPKQRPEYRKSTRAEAARYIASVGTVNPERQAQARAIMASIDLKSEAAK